jgi:outer membrane protein assembly factor BamB
MKRLPEESGGPLFVRDYRLSEEGDGSVTYALDGRTGAELWRRSDPGEMTIVYPPVIEGCDCPACVLAAKVVAASPAKWRCSATGKKCQPNTMANSARNSAKNIC